MVEVWSWTLPALLGLFILVWVLSLRLRDVSIVDIAWGPGFLVVTGIVHRGSPDPGSLAHLTLLLAALWALRLGGHLWLRALGRGEDPRYAEMRAAHGDAFPLRSLFTVFWLQALLIWVLSLPLAVAAASSGPPGVLGRVGAAVFLAGFATEVIADAQLAAFRNRERQGVLDTGLWRYSRHPNYFGEAVLWWGFWILAVAAGGAWTVFAPVGMTVLLLKVSGVPLLESRMRAHREGYEAYARRTSAFIPWPPSDR